MNDVKTLDLSWSTILKIGFFVFFVYLIFLIKDILILALFSFIIAFLFEPAILFFEEKKIPRLVSVLIMYLSFFVMIGFLVFLISSHILVELQKFLKDVPTYFDNILPILRDFGVLIVENGEDVVNKFQNWILNASKNIFSALFAIFGGIFSTLTIFFLSLFISLEKGIGEKIVYFFSPRSHEERFLEIFRICQKRVSAWFGSRILSSIFVFILTFISLKIFDVDYSISLSLVAGFLNIIPILGPIIGGFLIFLITVISSLEKAIFAVLAFTLIQQIDGYILGPILTKKFVGISPFLTLISLLIGGKLLGFWGAIFAIPLTAMVIEIVKEMFKKEI